MPILQPFGPSAGPLSGPRSITGASAAARRSGVLPMPSLEWNSQVERETAHLYDRVKTVIPAGRMAVLRALRQGDQRAQAGAQRGHPGAQLSDAGDIQLRRRFRRRFAPARARGGQGRCRHHRPVRRAFHGRDREDPQPGQDRADPRPQGRLLARGFDHRRGRAAVAGEIPGRARRRLCQHLGRGQSRGRHLLHFLECPRGGREPRPRYRHLPARPVSGEICRRAHQGEDHFLAGRLRGARAFHRRRACGTIARAIRRCRSSRIRNARPT